MDWRFDQRSGGACHRMSMCARSGHPDGHHGRNDQGRREWHLILKSREALERSGRVNVVVLDKTGTITRGEPALTDMIPMKGYSATELLRLAASAGTFDRSIHSGIPCARYKPET